METKALYKRNIIIITKRKRAAQQYLSSAVGCCSYKHLVMSSPLEPLYEIWSLSVAQNGAVADFSPHASVFGIISSSSLE
jgi:hypothetical protein